MLQPGSETQRRDGLRVPRVVCSWLLALAALGASGAVVGQPAAVGFTATPCPPPEPAGDWPNLCRYKEANAALDGATPPAAVFMGDSITEGWVAGDPGLFTAGVVGRGISAQTSPQMLLRFRQDVVALAPRVVHIMAGTNDIAGNTGPTTTQDFKNNILAMIDLARANDIAVILAGIPPSKRLYWRGELDPRRWIRELNDWLRATADAQGLVFVDYAAVLADSEGGLRAELSSDGVHPNGAGYAAMRPLTDRALAAALARRARN